MNPYLRTLFQNLFSAEAELERLREKSKQPQQGYSNFEILGICKDVQMDSERLALVKAEVDNMIVNIYAADRKLREMVMQHARRKRDAAEVAIETYMSIHYKFTEPD